MDGKAVQLVQGKEKKLEREDVMQVADELKELKWPIDVIDLDAAMSKGENVAIVKELCKKMECRVGGGIRTVEKAKEIIDAGASKVIIGTSAFDNGKLNVKFLSSLNEAIGKNKIIVSVDSKEGKIVDKGWTESTGINTLDVVKELQEYCSEIFYTYVDKEGMMEGNDIETVAKIKEIVDIEVTAAGGVSSIEEVRKLEEMGVNSVIGMAYYTGKISMDELIKLKGE